MGVALDEKRLQTLLAKADTSWFSKHGGGYNYRSHLEFSAQYVARHYNDRRIKTETSG